ncbi:hypothetical protein ACSXDZ_11240 [Clostridium perfringens]
MDSLVNIATLVLTAFQLGGGVAFVYCLIKAGYKCFGEKTAF